MPLNKETKPNHNCDDYSKKRLMKNTQGYKKSNTHHVDSYENHNMRISNNKPLTTTSQVTDLTKTLSNIELNLLSLWPKFIMTQKLDDKILPDIETNFCRAAYQLKWLSKILDEFTTTTNTNTSLIYSLDYPIHL